MNLELLIATLLFLSGGGLIFLAITVTRDNISSRLHRLTGAMLAFAAVGALSAGLHALGVPGAAPNAVDNPILYKLHFVWEFFFPLLLLFSWAFPEDRLLFVRRSRLRYLVFLPQVTHIVVMSFYVDFVHFLDLLQVDPTNEGFSTILLRPLSHAASWISLLASFVYNYQWVIFGSINVLYILLATYFLETGYRFLTNPRLQTQTRIVLWATRLGPGLFVVFFVGRQLVPSIVTEQVGEALMILATWTGGIVLALATVRNQFLDVRLVFRQSFINTPAVALLVGVYLFIIIRSRIWLTPLFGAQAELVSYGFVILLLLTFQPMYDWLDNIIRSMFIRSRTDHRNILETFSRQVISLFDPEKARRIIDETLKTALLVDRVYFVLYDDAISEYAIVSSDEYPNRIVVDREDMLLRGINQLDSPTYLHMLSSYTEESLLAAIMKERRVKLVLPMKEGEHLLGFVALSEKAAGYRYSSDDINLLGTLTNQMVTALINARLYVESLERIRLQEEVAMARQIQIGLLPTTPPSLNCGAIHATSTPSRTVGGDFYDFILISEKRLGILIADASGKGMPAALMIAQIQAIIRSEINNGNSIPDAMRNMNQQIVGATTSEKYVTLFYGELDLANNRFQYTNAGHNYPILARANGSMELLMDGGPIIGALPDMEYSSSTVQLSENDLLFLFTDGVSEAMDENDNEYGEERLRQLVLQHRQHDPDTVVARVLEDVRRFDPLEPPRDDTTIVALKMTNSGKTNGSQ
ncbi:MAG: PP2C family protein-serine/threonine phosphatase [Candidatus Zixiibacteriota bacterium]